MKFFFQLDLKENNKIKKYNDFLDFNIQLTESQIIKIVENIENKNNQYNSKEEIENTENLVTNLLDYQINNLNLKSSVLKINKNETNKSLNIIVEQIFINKIKKVYVIGPRQKI
ncbi:hypothetical protein PPERSA_13036 [Pseudocohnilembus persalinus]|uniref:Uncharacterized protein n=1 Tax=Pseudocohnilembus persalinus TaxID=266149 RepID=A0A0V0R233_PSEPJ|nr:hypothetical protein PPERSA_13036 [Pseudocohnilembus persalinus]|eukprot:KRX08555.1 hypothetical protein PPERSA_13036 [Pseudocohnilembus persalinus]